MCNRYLILNALAKAASELSNPVRKVIGESASATVELTNEGIIQTSFIDVFF